MSEEPVRVSIATFPNTDERGAVANDVELAKAAILYADDVERVGLGVAMFDSIRASSEGGMTNLFASLDDDVMRAVSGGRQLPPTGGNC